MPLQHIHWTWMWIIYKASGLLLKMYPRRYASRLLSNIKGCWAVASFVISVIQRLLQFQQFQRDLSSIILQVDIWSCIFFHISCSMSHFGEGCCFSFSWIPWNLPFLYIHCTGQFTPKMKANAEPRLLSSLMWIDSGIVLSQHCLE